VTCRETTEQTDPRHFGLKMQNVTFFLLHLSNEAVNTCRWFRIRRNAIIRIALKTNLEVYKTGKWFMCLQLTQGAFACNSHIRGNEDPLNSAAAAYWMQTMQFVPRKNNNNIQLCNDCHLQNCFWTRSKLTATCWYLKGCRLSSTLALALPASGSASLASILVGTGDSTNWESDDELCCRSSRRFAS